MRTLSRITMGVLAVMLAACTASAQDELIGLEKVHQLVVAKQMRPAARALSEVSVEFRRELGRCHDEAIGGRMMQTEPKFDALGAKLAAGTVTTVGAVEKEFAEYDHLLAEHHQQLAADGWARPRFTKMETVAKDVGLAARYLERAARWEKQPLTAEAQKAVDDALALAKQLGAEPTNPPATSAAVIDALGQAVKRPTRVAQGRMQ